jgi:hypothetical protein
MSSLVYEGLFSAQALVECHLIRDLADIDRVGENAMEMAAEEQLAVCGPVRVTR